MGLPLRILARLLAGALALSVCSVAGLAQQADGPVAGPEDPRWQAVLDEARGQTVYFNGWGGSDRINDYVAWAAGRVAELYGIEVVHVRVGDAAEVVSRVLAERTAGRS